METAPHALIANSLLMLDYLDDPFFRCDNEFRLTYVNAQAEKVVEKSGEALYGRTIFEVFHNDRTLESECRRVIQERTPTSFETYYESRDKWFEVAVYPAGGNLTIHFRDITRFKKELEQSRADLNSATEKLDSVLESITEALVELDPEFHFIYLNKAAEHMLGASREKMLGKCLWEVYPRIPDDVREMHFAKARLERTPSSFEIFSPTHNRWFDIHVYPAGSGGITVLFLDISDRKRAEEELERGREVASLASEAGLFGSFIWRFAEDRISVSPELYELYGLEPSTDEQNGDFWMAALHPDDRGRAAQAVNDAVRQRLPSAAFEFRTLNPPGETRWIHCRANFRYDQQGAATMMIGISLNITDRKRLEEEVRRSEERLRVAQRAARCGVWNWELATDRVEWSPEIYHLFGLDTSTPPGNAAWLAAIHPDHRDRAQADIALAIQERRPYHSEFLVAHDGESHWVESFGDFVCDEAGRAVRLAGIAVEITERKQIEEELIESRRRFQTMAEAVPEILFTVRPDGTTDYVNQRWYDYTGIAVSPALSWSQVFHPDDLELARERWTEAVQKGIPFDLEHRLRRFDGEYRWFRGHAVPLRNEQGETIKWFGVNVDIHDNKVLAQNLADWASELELTVRTIAESEAQLRAVASAVPEVLFTANADGTLDFISQRAVDYTGLTIPALLSKNLPDVLHPDDRPKVMSEWIRAFAAGKEFGLSLRLRRHDGAYRWFQCRAVPVQNSEGEVVKWFGVVSDIHDHKKLEEELSERTRELSRTNADLQHFSYAASHDLQEPLRSIAAFSELLARKHQDNHDPQAREFIDYIQQGVSRLQKLISALLEYGRISHLGPVAPETAINLQAALGEALWSLQGAIEKNGAVITYDPLPTVLADQRQMSQVFLNLVGNAVKYRSEAPPQIHISSRAEAGEWVISVRDNGIGFDMKYAETIFGVFQRLHSKSSIGGTGIGLAIVKRIIERHHGRIWAEAQAGHGAIFRFTLPRIES